MPVFVFSPFQVTLNIIVSSTNGFELNYWKKKKQDGCPWTTCRACVTLIFDLGPTCTNVSNGTSTHDGEQLYKFILKSIQNCRSYGPDKNLTFKFDLNLGPTWTNASNDTSTCDEINCVKSFWNPSTNVEGMVRTNSDARIHARTYTELSF